MLVNLPMQPAHIDILVKRNLQEHLTDNVSVTLFRCNPVLIPLDDALESHDTEPTIPQAQLESSYASLYINGGGIPAQTSPPSSSLKAVKGAVRMTTVGRYTQVQVQRFLIHSPRNSPVVFNVQGHVKKMNISIT